MSVFILECSDFWGKNFQVDIKEGVGGGSDLNVQLILSSCVTLSIVYKHYHPMLIPSDFFLLMPDVSSPRLHSVESCQSFLTFNNLLF